MAWPTTCDRLCLEALWHMYFRIDRSVCKTKAFDTSSILLLITRNKNSNGMGMWVHWSYWSFCFFMFWRYSQIPTTVCSASCGCYAISVLLSSIHVISAIRTRIWICQCYKNIPTNCASFKVFKILFPSLWPFVYSVLLLIHAGYCFMRFWHVGVGYIVYSLF